jgi:hypothetical protein
LYTWILADFSVDSSGFSTSRSMIKAKFRDHLSSKTPTAMISEVLCKIVCHNICVVVQEAGEGGIAMSAR